MSLIGERLNMLRSSDVRTFSIRKPTAALRHGARPPDVRMPTFVPGGTERREAIARV
jgi:hypothetical protein